MGDVKIEFGGDVSELVRENKKLLVELAKVDTQLKTIGKASRQAAVEEARRDREARRAAAEQSAAWKRVGGEIRGMVGGYASLAGAVRLVGQAFQFAKQQSDSGLASMRQMLPARQRLAQVATSSADLKTLRGRADVLAQMGGISREQASGLVFSARSEGFEGALSFIARAAPLLSVDAQATAAGQLKGLFPSKPVSSEQAIAGAFVGAQASRLNAEELLRSLPQAGEGVNQAGGDAAEAIAALSVLSSRFKSGDVAADRIKNLGSKLSLDERTSGRGFLGGFDALMGMDEAGRRDFLGDSVELNSAFKAMSEELGTIRDRERDVRREMQAIAEDPSTSKFMAAVGVAREGFAAELDIHASEIGLEVAKEEQLARARAGSIGARLDLEREQLKLSPMERFFGNLGASTAESFGASPETVDAAGRIGAEMLMGSELTEYATGTGRYAPQLESSPQDLDALERATRNLERAGRNAGGQREAHRE